MLQQSTVPLARVPLSGAHGIPQAVREMTGPRGLARTPRPPAPKALEKVGVAVDEVLSTIVSCCGEQDPARAGVELWVEPELAVIAVRFAGAPLPGWLLANWDRGEEPTVLTPPTDSGWGWGWPAVREAVESVSLVPVPDGQMLLLEKRL